MIQTIEDAVSRFGERAKSKLSNPAVKGTPEDQLRSPFEGLLEDIAVFCHYNDVKTVGEVNQSELKTRPDYAVTANGALVGFVELKAPGKGADPRKFKDPHDKDQWERLRSLPNLIYTDGNSFSLWRNGDLVEKVLRLDGDVESSGKHLGSVPGLQLLFESFLNWQPIAPKSARDLAETTARLCRLLRDEVAEQLSLKSPGLTSLAEDWRNLLFPEANDKTFADGYAQAVTFGLLMARAKDIQLSNGMGKVASELAQTSSLIGTALRLLTDSEENQTALKTALGTLVRVLDAVDWKKISKGDADAWLYFYENFLEVYDNDLRKLTGSYYTPPEVVSGMVSLVDEALRSKFNLHDGLAASSVTLADPATGTGTFFLGVLKSIVNTVQKDQGEGAIPGAVTAALKRLIAFEMQLGPFAVAQLRILAEVVNLTGKLPKTPPRMFVTNTLSDPEESTGWIPQMLAPLANQRKDANRIMRDEPITVVIGNPPYKDHAGGQGSWIENGASNSKTPAPLQAWMPPAEWNAGVFSRHLRNLYIYFWRWATWKVFDQGPGSRDGIICFITVAGFLSGPGFQKMRAYLRDVCEDVWVIDCSPEGHQPSPRTRIFQGVQQPVCIVIASRSPAKQKDIPAAVHFRSLPIGNREEKFQALSDLRLSGDGWAACPTSERAPFLPKSLGQWATFPRLDDLFIYNGSGIMSGRVWIISPDAQSLIGRWDALLAAPRAEKTVLFHPHLRKGKPGDKHVDKIVSTPLHGFPKRPLAVSAEAGSMNAAIRFGFRSFDRQWIIPDARLINQPNPELWQQRSDRQIFATAFMEEAPTSGPALTFTGLVPDVHHYKGSFGGRVFSLWRDAQGNESNFKAGLIALLGERLGMIVGSEDLMAYIAAIASHPTYTARFQEDLSTPGLRIPITADKALFSEAKILGRRVLWLQTFGERMADAQEGRPAQPPRLQVEFRPTIPKEGAIPEEPDQMPDTIEYDAEKNRLLIGTGFVDNVTSEMWEYEVSGNQVLTQWFSYRKRNRGRQRIGNRRAPSKLGEIQPHHWLPEYTTELLNVLNVLGLLIEMEPEQAKLLDTICSGPLISEQELKQAGALDAPSTKPKKSKTKAEHPQLF
jgi:Type ISP C-terminal specificity domain/N-6 DNA Methylase